MPSGPNRRFRKRVQAAAVGARSKTVRVRTARAGRASSPSELELGVLQCFRTIFASARAHDADVRRIAGISGSQLWALSEIGSGAGMSVNDLSERMALHQTTASNLVNVLTERKLIRRVKDDADQRIVRLHITTEGKKMLLHAPGPYVGLLVDALKNMEARDLDKLRKSLAVLLGVMRDKATAAAGETLLGE